MDNNFIPKAIELVTQAIAADQEKRYEEAFGLYERSLEYFVTGLKYEKNERTKDTLRKKIAEYMDRAEQLKDAVRRQKGGATGPEDAGGGGGGAVGTNRRGAGGKESEGDADKSKLRAGLDSSILSEKPNVKWDDVAGLEGAKEALKEAVVLPIRFPNLFTGNRKPWKGILLYGPPGTGKSYLAKAVATEVDSTFFSISSSDLVSKWLGESERLVRNLFEMASEQKPSIIFIDEIDALCGSRSDGESDASRRMKNEFLVRMQGAGTSVDVGVLVLGATNIPWSLDPGIRRRFEKRIYIPLPEPHARSRVFEIHVGGTPHSLTPADFVQLGHMSDGYTGSDISVAVRDALMEPVRALQAATHFRQEAVGADAGKWTPCSPGHPQAREMTLMDMKPDLLLPPEVSMVHFLKVMRNAKPTVSKSDLERYTQFTSEFGMEG
ncbi:P-loop containing nucleoside triphosphate hydrolase protein [Pavlovales sp. CCMP2436]|nr:P-loop containing nucleoside triphosphate hydrolase protein [Pavlovales sp. CCMP2436]